MKASRDRWVENCYPLIEARMSRKDCVDWWAARSTGHWDARPSSPAPSSHAADGSSRNRESEQLRPGLCWQGITSAIEVGDIPDWSDLVMSVDFV